MQTIRQAILAEVKRRGMTTNQLALAVPKISRSLMYDFVAGNSDLTTEKAEVVLRALGLKITIE